MKHKHLVFTIAWVIGVAFALAAPMAGARDLTEQKLAGAVGCKVTEIAPAEAKAEFDRENAVFLDCREPSEYESGHIPGAINIPSGLMESEISDRVPDNAARIIMYCRTGVRANSACLTVESMGFRNVVNIQGGWKAWSRAGYPVE